MPAAPVVTSITPANGSAGGGAHITVHGTGLSAATAIEIGTTAEFAAGTPITLDLCSAPAPGCFTVISASTIDISAMPNHPAGLVQVSVVSLGISGTGTHTYKAGPALLFPAPPGGEVNVAYSDQLTVTGGTSPFTWSVSAGALPAGITLGASTGLLSGTPTTAGSYSFTVMVTDNSARSATESVSLSIIAGPSLSFPAPPAGWTHTVYGDTLTESGGTSPFTWSVSSGSLPAGISLLLSDIAPYREMVRDGLSAELLAEPIGASLAGALLRARGDEPARPANQAFIWAHERGSAKVAALELIYRRLRLARSAGQPGWQDSPGARRL